jgi:methionyl-tRNA formyltransferase
MDGVTDTGVCIMRMTPGLDEGPVADRTRISVGPADTAGELGRSLALLGAIGIGRLFTGLGDGTVNWTEQEGAVTYAAKLGASDRIFDPTLAVRRLHDRVRALSPDAGCDAVTDGGMRLKIWRTWHESTEQEAERSPGRCRFEDERLVVDCSDGRLAVLALQPAGKRVMSSAEFFRGYHDRVGQHLGPAHAGREEE